MGLELAFKLTKEKNRNANAFLNKAAIHQQHTVGPPPFQPTLLSPPPPGTKELHCMPAGCLVTLKRRFECEVHCARLKKQ